MRFKQVNKLWRVRTRGMNHPPPNPLEDPIAHIKRPLNPLYADRRGQGVVRPGQPVVEFDQFDVKHIRAKFCATQYQFARLIGVSLETLRNWERGRRRPSGPARALLRAIDADPIALGRALNWRARDFKEEPIDWLDM
jgi:putative transcriptional regulator